jgi:hypothetical protein
LDSFVDQPLIFLNWYSVGAENTMAFAAVTGGSLFIRPNAWSLRPARLDKTSCERVVTVSKENSAALICKFLPYVPTSFAALDVYIKAVGLFAVFSNSFSVLILESTPDTLRI